MTEQVPTIINELEDLPEELEKITKNPIVKPLLDFREAVKSLLRDNSAEREYLESKMKRLDELLATGIYENSYIAQRYADVLEVYKRLFLIFTKYTEVADDTVKKIRRVVSNDYLTWEEHRRVVNQLQKKGSSYVQEEDLGLQKAKKETEDDINIGKSISKNPWVNFLREFKEKHPNLSASEITKKASEEYTKIHHD